MISASELNILDVKDEKTTTSSTHQTETLTVEGEMNASYVNGGSMSADVDYSKENSESTSYNNSHLNTANLVIKTKDDMNVVGSNIVAKNADIDVGGNLNVESVQDTYTSTEERNGVSVSNYFIPSGASHGKTNANTKKVNEQASIITENRLELDVEGNTKLKGGVISSQNGNMAFTTNTIEYEDVKDESHTIGYDLSYKDSVGKVGVDLEDKRGFNYATLGAGEVTVKDGNDLEGLNRDASLTSYSSIDFGTHAEIDSDIAQVEKNLLTIKNDGARSVDISLDILGSTIDSIAFQNGHNPFSAVDSISMKFAQNHVARQFAEQYPELMAVLNDPNAPAELREMAMQTQIDLLTADLNTMGYNISNVQVSAYASKNKNSVAGQSNGMVLVGDDSEMFVNLATDKSKPFVLGHEIIHNLDNANGVSNANDAREGYADNMGSNLDFNFGLEAMLNGIDTHYGDTSHTDYTRSSYLNNTNQRVSVFNKKDVDQMVGKIFKFGKKVYNGKGFWKSTGEMFSEIGRDLKTIFWSDANIGQRVDATFNTLLGVNRADLASVGIYLDGPSVRGGRIFGVRGPRQDNVIIRMDKHPTTQGGKDKYHYHRSTKKDPKGKLHRPYEGL